MKKYCGSNIQLLWNMTNPFIIIIIITITIIVLIIITIIIIFVIIMIEYRTTGCSLAVGHYVGSFGIGRTVTV